MCHRCIRDRHTHLTHRPLGLRSTGYDSEGAQEMMRLYQTVHADHEGGNVSAHATHLASQCSDLVTYWCNLL